MKCAAAPVLVLLALAGCASPSLAANETAQLTAKTDEPRAYGYQVGDLITRDTTVWVPQGLQLDTASLPTAGRVGHTFELRRVRWQPLASTVFTNRPQTPHQLLLQYQVFLSPRAVRTLELPPITLRFTGTPRAQDLRIDAWPVTVAPLVPAEVSARTGLGEMQPDAAPPLLHTQPATTRLTVYASAAALLLAWLAHIYGVMPWLARRQRPFEQAWRALKTMPADNTPQAQRAALQTLHQALNRSAGSVLFEHSVDGFVSAQPRYAPLRDDLLRFFQHSRRNFFGPQTAAAAASPAGHGADPDPAALTAFVSALCRRCRDAERGTA